MNISNLLLFLTILSKSTSNFFNFKRIQKQILSVYQKSHSELEILKVIPHHPSYDTVDIEFSIERKIVCKLCSSSIESLIDRRRKKDGSSGEAVLTFLTFMCEHLKYTEQVCENYIKIFTDGIIYAIDHNKNFSSERYCGLALQTYNCPIGDHFDRTISLPPKNPKKSQFKVDGPNFRILHLSDFHYDPNYTPDGNAVCEQPLCCQNDQKTPLSLENKCGCWTDYRNADIPWQLLEETVQKAKKKEFDFVYYTGDIVSHRAWDNTADKVAQTLTKVHLYLKKNFEVPVISVLGNHDVHPLDQWPPYHVDSKNNIDWLFKLCAEQYSNLVGQNVTETVLKGGYYTVVLKPGFRIIALNSNVADTHNNWLLYDDAHLWEQLQWFADTLKEAESNNEYVHVLTHIPPGASDCLKTWDREYKRIVERFSHVITGQFNGHSHKDEFRIFYSSTNRTEAISVSFNGASVTPFSNTNPSFKYYEINGTTLSVLDLEEYTFNLTLANSQCDKSPLWYQLYSFRDAYGVDSLVPSEMDKVVQKMTQDSSIFDNYFRFYHRNVDDRVIGFCDDRCKRNLLCQIVMTEFGDGCQCNRFLKMFETNK